ncbi:hypothetical protein [Nitriliruptor alkaliphilus]|uniref:hypothetical protein n=1 Tax=Nitriliruptor alkaliphilus TaxID=427918 RepID=UPI0012ED19AA|nr:hypothetical protein [Nitriliruptor alkaliphilus]
MTRNTWRRSDDQLAVDLDTGSGRRSAILVLAMLTMLTVLGTATPAIGAPAGRSTAPVITIPPPVPPALVGSSTLVRTDHGISVTLETSQLQPDHVVTLWWIVANAPEECEAGLPGLSRCGPADHLAGRGAMSVHHAAGRVAGVGGSARYGAHLRVGDPTTALFEGDPGLTDARGAEVILILKSHGPRIPTMTADMLRTFAGGCVEEEFPPGLTPRPDVLGTPGPNEACAEIQVSVHNPA